jgi:hypothetical protein
MKKLLLTTSIVALSLLDAIAGGVEAKTFKEVKTVVTPEPCRFRDFEWQIDAFYTHFWGRDGVIQKGGPGGGFGVNYFFLRYFGVGYEAAWFDNDGIAFHLPVGGNFFLRYPICAWNLAPYVLVGGGAAWDHDVHGYGNVGGGLEYRFTDHIGAFVDGRYFYGSKDGFGNVANLRAGMRFAF